MKAEQIKWRSGKRQKIDYEYDYEHEHEHESNGSLGDVRDTEGSGTMFVEKHQIEAIERGQLAARATQLKADGNRLVVESPNGVGIEWRGAALLDGRPWPAADGETLWLPVGRHTVAPAARFPAVRLLDLTGELLAADNLAGGLEFSYRSDARAFAVVDKRPHSVEIDGAAVQPEVLVTVSGFTLRLPRGQHSVRIHSD